MSVRIALFFHPPFARVAVSAAGRACTGSGVSLDQPDALQAARSSTPATRKRVNAESSWIRKNSVGRIWTEFLRIQLRRRASGLNSCESSYGEGSADPYWLKRAAGGDEGLLGFVLAELDLDGSAFSKAGNVGHRAHAALRMFDPHSNGERLRNRGFLV